MKKFISILTIVFISACGSKVSDLELRVAKLETEIASMRKGGVSTIMPAGAFPKFTFEQEEHNFGQIRDGDIVSHTFRSVSYTHLTLPTILLV